MADYENETPEKFQGENFILIRELEAYSANNQNKYVKISGYIKKIFDDEKMIYLSCPQCRKKILASDNKKWRCEHCNKEFLNNIPTYMLSAVVSDLTGNVII